MNDRDRAKPFYTEKLGWEVRDDVPTGENMRRLSVVPPGAQTALVLVKGFSDWPEEKVGVTPGSRSTSTTRSRPPKNSSENGVEFSAEPSVQVFGGRAMFEDSEGNEIGMHTRAPS